MEEIRKQLIETKSQIETKIECPSEMIQRLRREGRDLGEIEHSLLELNKIKGILDSIETALRILEL